MTHQMLMQLGKNGLTPEFLDEIKKRFEEPKNKNMKIIVLKSCRESREDVKKYAEKITAYLGDKFKYRIIGFSIFVNKFRKSVKR